MNNFNSIKNSNLRSDNLQYKIDSFKNNFLNKTEYFTCEQDIVGITMSKYLEIIKFFFKSNFK